LSWSPDGYRLAGVYQGGQFLIWDILSGDEVYRDQTFNTGYTVDWSPDGKYLLLSGEFSNTPEIRRVWQSKEELIAFAKECCAWRELTPAERAQFGLEER
jgi:WD40 repeat protein